MTKELPAFQIEVTEALQTNGKQFIHKLAGYTYKICNELHLMENGAEVITDRLQVDSDTASKRFFYSKMAMQLSTLTNQELLDNFSSLRICFRQTRAVKNYDFRFQYGE